VGEVEAFWSILTRKSTGATSGEGKGSCPSMRRIPSSSPSSWSSSSSSAYLTIPAVPLLPVQWLTAGRGKARVKIMITCGRLQQSD
jgi:hypothetical protein